MPWPWRRRGLLLTLASVLLTVPMVAGLLIHVPYYLVSPGEARGVVELIKVKGEGAKIYTPRGQILFTTVSLAGRANLYQALLGWMSDEVEVIHEARITGGASREEVRQVNVEAMVDSKLTATKVALERLGYRVSVTGDGALVTMVKAGDPADGHLQVGDIITRVDGEAVSLHHEVVTKVRQHVPGDVIEIGFDRSGAHQTVSLKSIETESGARIGVGLQTYDLKYNFPIDVSIETGLAGGPSAGLAFTLALLDDLSPGELTGGSAVAVTGTIDVEGKVGQVGGVAQKTVTARRAGAVAFLVPPEEEKQAQAFAGKMKIIPVRDLTEALAALEKLGGTGVAFPDAPATSPPA